MRAEVLNYYRQAESITNLDKYKKFTDWIVADPSVIGQIVQGLIVHDSWLEQYNISYVKEHAYPQQMAYMKDILDKALEIDKSNLAIPREPQNRVIACCREFATLMCAFLRAKGIPARSRCGFATYFGWSGGYEDHWICEFWNGIRWISWDPQIDPLQRCFITQWGLEGVDSNGKLKQITEFNPHDLTAEDFVSAGQAWILCRQAKKNPMKFGIGCKIQPEWGIDSLHGLWFVRGQLLRDFASLNKVETVPYLIRICKGLDWKPWYLVSAKDEELTNEDLALLDYVAELTCNPDENMEEIRNLYHKESLLQVPSEIVQR